MPTARKRNGKPGYTLKKSGLLAILITLLGSVTITIGVSGPFPFPQPPGQQTATGPTRDFQQVIAQLPGRRAGNGLYRP